MLQPSMVPERSRKKGSVSEPVTGGLWELCPQPERRLRELVSKERHEGKQQRNSPFTVEGSQPVAAHGRWGQQALEELGRRGPNIA